MSNLIAYYTQQKKSYGQWVANCETVAYMKRQLMPATAYHRQVNLRYAREVELDVQRNWRDAHETGQQLSRLIGKRDVAALTNLARDGWGRIGFVANSITLRRLTEKITSLRDDDGAPLVLSCNCCGSLAPAEGSETLYGGGNVCARCQDNTYAIYSEVMGSWLNRYDAQRAFTTGDAVDSGSPDDWVVRPWAQRNGFTQHSSVWYAEGLYDQSDELNTWIFGYHDGPELGHIPSAYDSRKPRVLLGMELEVENIEEDEDDCRDNTDIARSILKKLNGVQKGFVKAEEDGSLNNGFELITGYTGLDVHAKVWKKLHEASGFEYIHSHSTNSCGLHVHVDKAGMTPLHAAKLAQFVNASNNKKLMQCVARRYDASYAKFNWNKDFITAAAKASSFYIRDYKNSVRYAKQHNVVKPVFDATQCIGHDFHGDRYSALNFNNDHTVEFRMFRGTLKYESIMACLEFAFEAWHFARQASITDLSTEAFMEFICRPENRKDSVHLRAYLKAKNFRAFYQAEPKVMKKAQKIVVPTEREQDRDIYSDPEYIPLGYSADAQRHQAQQAARDFTLAA